MHNSVRECFGTCIRIMPKIVQSCKSRKCYLLRPLFMAMFSSFATGLLMDEGKRKKSQCSVVRRTALERCWYGQRKGNVRAVGVRCSSSACRCCNPWCELLNTHQPWSIGDVTAGWKIPPLFLLKTQLWAEPRDPLPEFQASLTSNDSLCKSSERMPFWGIVESK